MLVEVFKKESGLVKISINKYNSIIVIDHSCILHDLGRKRFIRFNISIINFEVIAPKSVSQTHTYFKLYHVLM